MDIKEIIDEAQNGGHDEWAKTEEESSGEETAWEETPPETPLESPKKKKRKLKPLQVIAIIFLIVSAGIIVFETFIKRPAAPPAAVKTNVFPRGLFLKAEKKAAAKVKTPVAGQAIPALLLAKPVKTVSSPVALPSSKAGGQANKANNLNDLFKLKTAAKPPVKTFPQATPAGFPGQVPATNFNGIPPNVLQNIQSKINGEEGGMASSGPRVLGVSNNFAVVQYAGADLYLKSGDSFGSCTVMSINSFDVRIACHNKLKKYPIEFAGEQKKANGVVNTVNLGVKK